MSTLATEHDDAIRTEQADYLSFIPIMELPEMKGSIKNRCCYARFTPIILLQWSIHRVI